MSYQQKKESINQSIKETQKTTVSQLTNAITKKQPSGEGWWVLQSVDAKVYIKNHNMGTNSLPSKFFFLFLKSLNFE